MSQPVSHETVLQAILELSTQFEEAKTELIEDIRGIGEKVEMINTKTDKLLQKLQTTQADVLRRE